MKKITFTVAFLLATLASKAQNAAINSTGTAPDASAMLDVSSTTKGILTPRMTAVQRAAIASPATGLLVYQTNGTDGFYYYDGAVWSALGGGSSYPSIINAETSISSTSISAGSYTTVATITVPSTGKYLLTIFTELPTASWAYSVQVTQSGIVRAGATSYSDASPIPLSIGHVLDLSSTTNLLVEAEISSWGGTTPNNLTGKYSLVKLAD